MCLCINLCAVPLAQDTSQYMLHQARQLAKDGNLKKHSLPNTFCCVMLSTIALEVQQTHPRAAAPGAVPAAGAACSGGPAGATPGPPRRVTPTAPAGCRTHTAAPLAGLQHQGSTGV
jgi:hypothetical protein